MVELTWLWVSFAAGLLCYIGLPWFVAPYLSDGVQQRIGRLYFWLSAMSYWRPKLVRRLLGGYAIVSSTFDAEKQGEKISLGGDTKHVTDPENLVSRWQNKHFGIVLEWATVIVDARLAELGEHLQEHARDDGHISRTTRQVEDGGRRTIERVNPYFEVPKGLRVVDPSTAIALIPRDANPSDPSTAEEYTRAAWAEHRQRIGTTEALSTLMGFGAGFLAVGASYKYFVTGSTGGGGSGGPIIPIGQLAVPQSMLDLVIGGGLL